MVEERNLTRVHGLPNDGKQGGQTFQMTLKTKGFLAEGGDRNQT